ncbi:guanine nucleotide exchange factor [Anaeramoeba ignava]|uniref:Guanine nucleotide exchange factor n=1 Tax=Anaeramoeba ignava TaxID=1746090 RepID=A0A9Q0RC68_ANAIG|nr:guanine nucleotide exchange factor [Anaeramoeba ignava]
MRRSSISFETFHFFKNDPKQLPIKTRRGQSFKLIPRSEPITFSINDHLPFSEKEKFELILNFEKYSRNWLILNKKANLNLNRNYVYEKYLVNLLLSIENLSYFFSEFCIKKIFFKIGDFAIFELDYVMKDLLNVDYNKEMTHRVNLFNEEKSLRIILQFFVFFVQSKNSPFTEKNQINQLNCPKSAFFIPLVIPICLQDILINFSQKSIKKKFSQFDKKQIDLTTIIELLEDESISAKMRSLSIILINLIIEEITQDIEISYSRLQTKLQEIFDQIPTNIISQIFPQNNQQIADRFNLKTLTKSENILNIISNFSSLIENKQNLNTKMEEKTQKKSSRLNLKEKISIKNIYFEENKNYIYDPDGIKTRFVVDKKYRAKEMVMEFAKYFSLENEDFQLFSTEIPFQKNQNLDVNSIYQGQFIEDDVFLDKFSGYIVQIRKKPPQQIYIIYPNNEKFTSFKWKKITTDTKISSILKQMKEVVNNSKRFGLFLRIDSRQIQKSVNNHNLEIGVFCPLDDFQKQNEEANEVFGKYLNVYSNTQIYNHFPSNYSINAFMFLVFQPRPIRISINYSISDKVTKTQVVDCVLRIVLNPWIKVGKLIFNICNFYQIGNPNKLIFKKLSHNYEEKKQNQQNNKLEQNYLLDLDQNFLEQKIEDNSQLELVDIQKNNFEENENEENEENEEELSFNHLLFWEESVIQMKNIVYENQNNQNENVNEYLKIKSTTLNKALEILTTKEGYSYDFVDFLLNVLPSYSTHYKLAINLFDRFLVPKKDPKTREIIEKEAREEIQVMVVDILIRIAQFHSKNIPNEVKEMIIKFTESYLMKYPEKKIRNKGETLKSMLSLEKQNVTEEKRPEKEDSLSKINTSDNCIILCGLCTDKKKFDLAKNSQKKPPLLFVSCVELAKQITRITYEKFSQITTKDLLNLTFATRDINEKVETQATNAFSRWFNFLSDWICTQILIQKDLTTRAKILTKFIKTALVLFKMRNLNDSFCFISSFQSMKIEYLSETWKKVPKNILAKYHELDQKLDPKRNYEILRKEFSQIDLPAIPYIVVFLSDLSNIRGLPNFTKENHLINWAKRRRFHHVSNNISKFQCVKYTEIEYNQQINHLINDCFVLSEFEMEKLFDQITSQSKKTKNQN